MKKLPIILTLFSLLVGKALLYGQTVPQGQIEDARIVIDKNIDIILPRREKYFIEPDLNKFRVSTSEKVDYTFADIALDLPRFAPIFPYQPYDLGEQYLSKIYPFYLRAGGGNFRQTYAEAYATTKRNERLYGGFHGKHRRFGSGPVDQENSLQSENKVEAFGSYSWDKIKLTGEGSFTNRQFSFYGYPEGEAIVNEDSLYRSYNDIEFSIGIEDRLPTADLIYSAQVQPYWLLTSEDLQETGIGLHAVADYPISDLDRIKVEFDGLFINQEAGDSSVGRNLTGITPTYTYLYNQFTFTAGFATYFSNDSDPQANSVSFFPILRAEYQSKKLLTIHAGISGQVEPFSLKTAYREMPWLAPSLNFNHTREDFRGELGAKIGLVDRLYGLVSIRYSSYTLLPFYINNPLERERFLIAYDSSSTGVFAPRLGVDYVFDQKVHAWLSGTYYSYSTDLEAAFHRPEWLLAGGVDHWLEDKLKVGLALNFMGGITALDPENQSTTDLGVIFDLDLRGEYFFAKHYSVFLNIDNIAAQNQERFLYYPSRGFQVLGGLSAAF